MSSRNRANYLYCYVHLAKDNEFHISAVGSHFPNFSPVKLCIWRKEVNFQNHNWISIHSAKVIASKTKQVGNKFQGGNFVLCWHFIVFFQNKTHISKQKNIHFQLFFLPSLPGGCTFPLLISREIPLGNLLTHIVTALCRFVLPKKGWQWYVRLQPLSGIGPWTIHYGISPLGRLLNASFDCVARS